MIVAFSLHGSLVWQTLPVKAGLIAPDPGSANLYGQISDSRTGDILTQTSVRLLGRESIEYYLWEDEDGQEHNECQDPLFQSGDWCYEELAKTQSDDQGNYFLECFDVCNLNPEWGYFTDLQAGKDGYFRSEEHTSELQSH